MDLAAARRFFILSLRAGTVPAEVATDQAPAYPRALDELIPSALHTVERAAGPMSSASSPAGTRSSASSAPFSPSRMDRGPPLYGP